MLPCTPAAFSVGDQKFLFLHFYNFQGGPGPGSHPVILRANSPATPGTIQDTLPPALPVQRIPNPHVCNYQTLLNITVSKDSLSSSNICGEGCVF